MDDLSKGAHTSSAFYSLIETAKANALKPYDYLMHVMQVMMQGTKEPEKLLPWKVALD